jgi:Mg-chelatase subunit ChlD
LVASRKFSIAKGGGPEALTLTASVASGPSGYEATLWLSSAATGRQSIRLGPEASLEKLTDDASNAVSQLRKRKGHIVKRDGDRIVVAAGRIDGLSVGQRYRTTDTQEEFIIERVLEETSVGRIVGTSGPPLPAAAASIGALDVVFVLDVSGSMQGEIDGIVRNCKDFADLLVQSKIDVRLGLVTFLDEVVATLDPVASPMELQRELRDVRAGGAVNERPFDAVGRALALKLRPEAKKVIVLITDEPAFDAIGSDCGKRWAVCSAERAPQIFDRGIAKRVEQSLRASGSIVLSVTLDDDQQLYRELAKRTGGLYMELDRTQSFSSVLKVLGKRIEGMFVEM